MKYKLIILCCFTAFSLSAQQKQVRDLQKEKQEILKDIEETGKLLEKNNTTITNALNRLNLLDQKIESRKKVISLLNQEIGLVNTEINAKEIQIKNLEKNLQQRKNDYSVALRKIYMHKRNTQENMLFLLSAQDFTQSFHRMMYLKKYSDWGKKQGEEIIGKQKIVQSEKASLLNVKREKLVLLDNRKAEEVQLTKEELDKKQEIKSLEKNKKKLQTDLADKQRKADALNRQIEKIIAEETAAATKNEAKENRKSEVKGGYAMTASEKTLSSNFQANKGKLPFPLKGQYKITGYFGVHQHKDLSRVTVNNNGIDIETVSGNEARAVFDGVVSRIFILPGYNNTIIVRHGNYLTLYSHIDQVYVKSGDKVKTGQSLGKIYTDKEKSNTLLHFELWKEQHKLDPLPWLNK
jgi:septal ring factor EnvC (AmiA/AmiB activator)